MEILLTQRNCNYESFLQTLRLRAKRESLGCDGRFVDCELTERSIASPLPKEGRVRKTENTIVSLGAPGPTMGALVASKKTIAVVRLACYDGNVNHCQVDTSEVLAAEDFVPNVADKTELGNATHSYELGEVGFWAWRNDNFSAIMDAHNELIGMKIQ